MNAGEKSLSERLLLVTGAYPPDVCGVGDYTARLFAAAPPNWSLLVERDWSLQHFPAVFRNLRAERPAWVVIQYPTQGYGWSIVPHLLIIAGRLTGAYRSVLALHEFTSFSPKAKTTLKIVSWFSDLIVFTTAEERDAARSSQGFSKRTRTAVVPIISNIARRDKLRPFYARNFDLAYFGHIRPNKGVEAFLKLAMGLRSSQPRTSIAIIGLVPAGYEAFAEQVANQCAKAGFALVTDADDERVADLLSDVRILYLPFPDGASARRGSILAGLGNGAVIASTTGRSTPESLARVLIPCRGEDDLPMIEDALAMGDDRAAVYQEAGMRYLKEALPNSWEDVVRLYQEAIHCMSATTPLPAN